MRLRGIRRIFLEHLDTFVSELDRYIPSHSYNKMFNWVRNAFEVSALEVNSEINCFAEQLIELQSLQMWRDKFKIVSLFQFWANVLSLLACHSDGTDAGERTGRSPRTRRSMIYSGV